MTTYIQFYAAVSHLQAYANEMPVKLFLQVILVFDFDAIGYVLQYFEISLLQMLKYLV
uniref:Uncharacterized protein n=1 Tax=Anguilla anguilla TaxID=7936 RepID=A0A0E9WNQ0_ANGAN